ncbi:hypothetical protein Tco_1556124 [Tanacetum coccineum]
MRTMGSQEHGVSVSNWYLELLRMVGRCAVLCVNRKGALGPLSPRGGNPGAVGTFILRNVVCSRINVASVVDSFGENGLPPQVTQLKLQMLGQVQELEWEQKLGFFLSLEQCSDNCLSSATQVVTAWVEELHLSKKIPPAAEFNESDHYCSKAFIECIKLMQLWNPLCGHAHPNLEKTGKECVGSRLSLSGNLTATHFSGSRLHNFTDRKRLRSMGFSGFFEMLMHLSKERTVADSIAARLTRAKLTTSRQIVVFIPGLGRMTTQSFRCKTHAHIHTTVSEFTMMVRRNYQCKARFSQKINDMRHVRLKDLRFMAKRKAERSRSLKK